MTKRKEKRINVEIGNWKIATYSKAHQDIIRIIPKVHHNYQFGICLLDIMGHKNMDISEIEKKVLIDNPLAWYKKESAVKSLYSLCEQINKGKENHLYDSEDVDELQMASMLYLLFGKEEINYANSAMNSPFILGKGELLEKGPPLGFFKIKKENIYKFEVGDLLFMYSDGLIENCLESGKIPEEIRKKAEKKIDFPNYSSNLLKLKTPSKDYEEKLIKLIEENPEKKIDVLAKEIKSMIDQEEHEQIDVRKKVEKERRIIKEYKSKIDSKIQEIIIELKRDFKSKIINLVEKHEKEEPKKIINSLFESYSDYIFPEHVKEEDQDDVTLAILKKIK